MYPFLRRYNLGIWTETKFGQKRNGHLSTIRISFVENGMENFDPGGEYATIQKSIVDNMDRPPVYIKTKSRSTFHPGGATIEHVRASGSRNSRTIVCCSVAADA